MFERSLGLELVKFKGRLGGRDVKKDDEDTFSDFLIRQNL